MKASELLSFVVNQRLNFETGCDIVQIDKDDDFFGSQEEFIETFFGMKPTKEIPEGSYLYVYSDCITFDSGGYADDVISKADLVLENEDYKIYLFRIED